MSITLKTIGLFGVILFGLLFSATFLSPETIEASAKGFVKYQIEKDIREKQQTLVESSVADKALGIAERLGLEKDKIQQHLDDDLPERIAEIIASMCGYDCERKKAVATSITGGFLDRIKNINIAQDTLGDIVKGKYVEILGQLKRDLRIFLGANAVLFMILLILSFAKPRAIPHLFLPGILLLMATLIASGIYLFGQDWFYTILYNDYMGFGYLAYVSVIFAALVDIVFNKGRVITEILNAILDAIGSAMSVGPCG